MDRSNSGLPDGNTDDRGRKRNRRYFNADDGIIYRMYCMDTFRMTVYSQEQKTSGRAGWDFPNAVSKITLLVTAGMNITRAIEETAQSDTSLIYQELTLVVKEMNRSSTLQGAFTRMQCRCSNKYLDKMITVISKSYASGNANLSDDLKEINDECWLDKKHSARRMSEAVQNRLYIPTMLMFIGILVVIIVPAMAGFNL